MHAWSEYEKARRAVRSKSSLLMDAVVAGTADKVEDPVAAEEAVDRAATFGATLDAGGTFNAFSQTDIAAGKSSIGLLEAEQRGL